MIAGVARATSVRVVQAAQAGFAWGQARRMHEEEAGLTVMSMALGLVILLVPLAILLMIYVGDATEDAESAFDSAVAGS